MALDLSSAVTSLLGTLGKRGYVKLLQPNQVYDPTDGTQTETPVTVDLYAADLPMPNNLVDGERILATDRMIIMDGTTEPTINDYILIGASTQRYSIVQIKPINHAGTPQAYKVVARG